MQVAIERAREAAGRRARRLGFGGRDAALLVDHFVDAELRGASTHGLERLRWIAGFDGLDPTARCRVLERGEGIARYDAAGRLGYFAERAAVTGLVCLVCASSTPRLGHPQGGPAVLGTNPFCLALPDG